MEDNALECISLSGGKILVQKYFNRERYILETKSDLIDSGKLDADDNHKSNLEDDK